MIHLAGYIAKGGVIDKAIRLATRGPVSHVELTNGEWWVGSSWRDGGVRFKRFTAKAGHWIMHPMPEGEQVWDDVLAHTGAPYDLIGALTGPTLGIPSFYENKWFCSELIADAMGLTDPWSFSPQALVDLTITKNKQQENGNGNSA